MTNTQAFQNKTDAACSRMWLYIVLVDMKSALTGKDRWSLEPALLSLMTVAAQTLLCQLPGTVSFLLIPFVLLGFAVTSIVVIIVAAYCFAKRRARKGASTLFIFLLPALLWRPTTFAAEIVHLGLTAGLGVGQLGTTPKVHDDAFAVYDWSVGFAGANTFLIHDITDQITLPIDQHTQPPNFEEGVQEDCAGKVEHLIAHYYVCTI